MGGETAMSRRFTKETRQIEQVIRKSFPDVRAYRYNSASIRVRVIDKKFTKMSRVERERLVDPLLDELPEDTKSDITILLLLAPHETATSPMNLEFEHPTPSRL
jgi:stress-induced morphogen